MIQFTWWTVVHCIFFFFIIVAVLLFNMQSFEYICFKYPCIKVFKANWTLESLKLTLASIGYYCGQKPPLNLCWLCLQTHPDPIHRLLFFFSLQGIAAATCCVTLLSILLKSAPPWDHVRGIGVRCCKCINIERVACPNSTKFDTALSNKPAKCEVDQVDSSGDIYTIADR